MTITREFQLNLPTSGILEFDYVSTTRPWNADSLTATSSSNGGNNSNNNNKLNGRNNSKNPLSTSSASNSRAGSSSRKNRSGGATNSAENSRRGSDSGLNSGRQPVSARNGKGGKLGGAGGGGGGGGGGDSFDEMDAMGSWEDLAEGGDLLYEGGGGGSDNEQGDRDSDENDYDDYDSDDLDDGGHGDGDDDYDNNGDFYDHGDTDYEQGPIKTNTSARTVSSKRSKKMNQSGLAVYNGISVTDEQFDHFLEQLGLVYGNRLSTTDSLYKLLELQVAVAKYYFPVQHVIRVLDSFSDDNMTQARVVVCMFSRIKDLYNFDRILRHLNPTAQQEVFYRLGYLNCLNPLKPNFDFVISLKHWDCRMLISTLIEISKAESGDAIKDAPRTDIPSSELYVSVTRTVNESRSEILRFTFCEVGERSTKVNWNKRIEVLQRFLVGTHPRDKAMYRIAVMHKEMVEAGTIGRGEIEQQYLNHLKLMKRLRNGNRSARSPPSAGTALNL